MTMPDRAQKEQLDDGVGDTFAQLFSFRVDVPTGVDTKVLPTPSFNWVAHRVLSE